MTCWLLDTWPDTHLQGPASPSSRDKEEEHPRVDNIQDIEGLPNLSTSDSSKTPAGPSFLPMKEQQPDAPHDQVGRDQQMISSYIFSRTPAVSFIQTEENGESNLAYSALRENQQIASSGGEAPRAATLLSPEEQEERRIAKDGGARRIRWEKVADSVIAVVSPAVHLEEPEVLLQHLLQRLPSNPSFPQYADLLKSHSAEVIMDHILNALTPEFKRFIHEAENPYNIKQ